MHIRKATKDDFLAIWTMFQHVIQAGDAYIYTEDTTKEEGHAIWLQHDTYIALEEDNIVGCMTIRPNKIGRGSHVCNAAFMVEPKHRGKSIGYQMGLFALKEAKQLGYNAMQFNVVVSTNLSAVHLWKKLEFNIIGIVPKAYQHKEKGLVDIYIMHRFL